MKNSKRIATVRTLLTGVALIVSTLTAVHAESANASQQHKSSADTQHTTHTRPDWNVDYPSQLGPQGVITADATPPHKNHKDNSQTRSPSD
jgi:cell division protein FtsN